MRVLPHGSRRAGDLEGDGDRLGASLIVRSPLTSYVSSPVGVTAVDVNVISGYVSISKKSLLRRWPSRSVFPVSMLVAWIVTWRLDLAGFSASK